LIGNQEVSKLPYTISHIAAVLPLKKASPKYFSFPALAVGSLSPDFAYMLHSYGFAGLSHSLVGIATFCAPLSLLLLGVLYVLRQGFAKWLGLPRSYFDPDVKFSELLRQRWLIFLISIVVGAMTHIVWDAFTHSGGYFVKMFPDVFSQAITIGFVKLRMFKWLQYGCSLLGLFAIACCLMCWYRNTYRRAHGQTSVLLFCSYATVILLSGLFAYIVTIATCHQIPVRSFVFQFFINSMRIALFIVLVVAMSLQVLSPKKQPGIGSP
jgi:hypothetical protein